MTEETQAQFFNDLIEVLMHHLGFYLPKDIIGDRVLEDLKDQIDFRIFDGLSVIDLQYGIGDFEVEEFNLLQINKRNLLEKNIFKLIKKENEIENVEFVYIIEKYQKQLAFFLYIAHWLKENFKIYHKDQTQLTVIGSFEVQYEMYNHHITEFSKKFGHLMKLEDYKRSFSQEEIIKIYLQDFITRYVIASDKYENQTNDRSSQIIFKLIESQVHFPDQNSKEKKEIKEVKTTKSKKEPLLTEKEIENFLFESVFNVSEIK